MTQPATHPTSAPTKTARHVRRTLRFAWLEYQDARDGVQLTRSLTAHGGWLNAFYALDPDSKNKKKRVDYENRDLDIGFETNASGSGIIARPQRKHERFLVEWLLSPGICRSKLTLHEDAPIKVDLLAISGHGSSGNVFGTDQMGNHTTGIDLNLMEAALRNPLRKGDVAGSLQYLIVATCNNLVFENFEMWQPLLTHRRGVRGIFGYRDAYTGDAQGAAIMNRSARAWRERPEETLLDNWRKANPHDPWAAIVLDDARGDTMQDWLNDELVLANDRRGMRHFDATSFSSGGRKLVLDPPITAKWVMADGTALDRDNRRHPHKGLLPGQRGKIVIDSHTKRGFEAGDRIIVVVNHYRPTKPFNLGKLLTLDASTHVRPLSGANKESGVKNLHDGFEVTVPTATRQISVDFTIKADAAKKFKVGRDRDQDFGYFVLSVWPPVTATNPVPERVYMYSTGAHLRASPLHDVTRLPSSPAGGFALLLAGCRAATTLPETGVAPSPESPAPEVRSVEGSRRHLGATGLWCADHACCASVSDGSLRCWGQDAEANPPHGDDGLRAVPTVVEGIRAAACVVIIDNFGCAVADGRVLCWPRLQPTPESYGMHVMYPPTPIPGLYDVTDISTRWDRGIALDRHGKLWGWGEEAWRAGRLSVKLPVVLDDRGDVVRAVIQKQSGCLLRRDGTVGCWGSDTYGTLGLGVRDNDYEHVPKQLPLKGIVELVGGRESFCALDGSGSVWCWGYSGGCATGGPDELRRPRPKRVRGVTDATSLRMQMSRTCVDRRSGGLWCWGDVRGHMLPEGVPAPDYNVRPTCEPVRHRELPPHVAIARGHDFLCVLQESGTVLCAGDNRRGELGDGTRTSRWAFAPVVW